MQLQAQANPRRFHAANIARGYLMGAADIVPGVSGGTVALIVGIYARLVTAISRFDGTALRMVATGRLREAAEYVDLLFLLSLLVGVGAGIGSLASLMHYLLEHQTQHTYAAFFGLIAASTVLARGWSITGIDRRFWRSYRTRPALT